MMNHADAVKRLDELFDGELPSAVAADVDHHVRACSHCQAALARRAELSRSLAGAEVQPPSSDFVQSVLAAIAALGPAAPPGVLRPLDAGQGRRAADQDEPAVGWARWVMPSLSAGLATAVVIIGVGLVDVRSEAGAPPSDPLALDEPRGDRQLETVERAESLDADQMLNLVLEES